MTIRDDILAVIMATGKPLQSKEIARVLGVSVGSVASHLGYMAKDGIVRKRTVAVGEGRQMGPFIFPESTAVLWSTRKTEPALRQVRHDARVHKTLPIAVIPRAPVPHTDDMIQMIEDLNAQMAQAFGVSFNQLGNSQ